MIVIIIDFVSNAILSAAIFQATSDSTMSHYFKYNRIISVVFTNKNKNVFSSKGTIILIYVK